MLNYFSLIKKKKIKRPVTDDEPDGLPSSRPPRRPPAAGFLGRPKLLAARLVRHRCFRLAAVTRRED